MKCFAGLLAAVALGVLVYRLELNRPIEQLEAAGAVIVLADDGNSGFVGLTSPAAHDQHVTLITRLRGVTRVNLSRSSVTRAGLRHLYALSNLKDLDLSETQVAEGGLRGIAEVRSLRSLNLRGCPWLRDEDLASLRGLDNLEVLDLSGTPVTDAGLAHLDRLPRLAALNLRDAALISDAGLAHLTNMPRLTHLSLDGCDRVTEEGIRELSTAPALERVSARGLQVRYRTLQEIRAAKPQFRVHVDVDYSALRALFDLCTEVLTDDAYTIRSIAIDGERPPGAGVVGQGVGSAVGLALLDARPAAPSSDLPPRPFDGASPAGIALDDAMAVLANYPEIRSITLRRVPVSDLGLSVLSEVRELQFLYLEHVVITDAGLRRLWPLPDLRVLRLEDVRITGEGLAGLDGLTTLSIVGPADGGLTEHGMQAIGALPALTDLSLEVRVPEDGLEYFRSLTSLESLSLTGPASEGGLRHLESLPRLRSLSLQEVDASAAELNALAANTSLEYVHFRRSTLDPDGLAAFARCDTLRSLSVHECDVREDELERVCAQRPEISVVLDGKRVGSGN